MQINLLETLKPKQDVIEYHVNRILTHLLEQEDDDNADPCQITMNVIIQRSDKAIFLDMKIKSTIPNQVKSKVQLGQIDVDKEQLKLL